MVTVKSDANKFSSVGDFEFTGLSTDSKPTKANGKKVGVNSLFLELDTGDLYYYTGSAWSKFGGES